MNNTDVITYIAQSEAKKSRNIFFEDTEDDCSVPILKITKNGNCYSACGLNYENHVNCERMPVVCNYLQCNVLPNIDNSIDVSGLYKIELEDKVDPTITNGCLCFSRSQVESDSYPLLPDEFQMRRYDNILSRYCDTTHWGEKLSRALFCGTTTGNRNPKYNERLLACDWAYHKASSYADFYITKVAQITIDSITSAYPESFKHFFKPFVPVEQHYKYRYLVNIAGNTCCWNRVPLIMNSKSLMLSTYQGDMCWYYPALHEGTHYVPVNLSGKGLQNTMKYYDNNPEESKMIVRNANNFVKQYMNNVSAMLYSVVLFENINYLYGR